MHAAQGDERAAGQLTRAVELFASMGLPLEAARAQLELARTLADSARAAAVREGKLAIAAFDRLGALPDADAAAGLLRSLGDSAGRAWPRGAEGLTRREREVLGLLAEGCSNAQIAERLVISTRTAEHHVANILSKLGLRSRSEAPSPAVSPRARFTTTVPASATAQLSGSLAVTTAVESAFRLECFGEVLANSTMHRIASDITAIPVGQLITQ